MYRQQRQLVVSMMRSSFAAAELASLRSLMRCGAFGMFFWKSLSGPAAVQALSQVVRFRIKASSLLTTCGFSQDLLLRRSQLDAVCYNCAITACKQGSTRLHHEGMQFTGSGAIL